MSEWVNEEKKSDKIWSCGNITRAAKNEHVREKLNIIEQRMRIEDKERTTLM